MSYNQIRTISPATNSVIYEHSGTSIEESQNIAIKSQIAFYTWRLTTLAERKKIVDAALRHILADKENLGREITLQMGRPISYSSKEIETMYKRGEYILNLAEEALADLPGVPEEGFKRVVTKEPIGPSLIASAWNFPHLTLVSSLVPALLAGNTVILRAPPQTPLIGVRFLEAFQNSGLPENVLQLVNIGSMEVLQEVAKLPQIQLVTFTGSTAGGIGLQQATAKRIIPLNLELGGKDPALVRSDADITKVAANLVDGAVFNSGQSCCSVERIYVHAEIHDELVKEIQQELKTYILGDPFNPKANVGPVVSQAAKEKIEAQVKDALKKGALDVTPQVPSFEQAKNKGSNYVAPTVLINVNHSMSIMKDETFGPIIPIQKVKDDDEAIKLMNDSEYGLTASIWTEDVSAAEQLLSRIEAGTVFINRCDFPSPDLAWTGWKNSGIGCTLGPRGFDGFFKLKSVHIKMCQ